LGRCEFGIPVNPEIISAKSISLKVSVILVEDTHPLALLRGVNDRKFDATHAILDVNKRSRLTATSMNRQRIANGRLHEKTIEHRSTIAVLIESIDQSLIE
jgi:hypothetical protein